MMKTNSNPRLERNPSPLRQADVDLNPIVQFQVWFEEALSADMIQPDAMTLATSTQAGRPSARMVLLKGFDERGFIFYTNYESGKGQELARNPWAALVFWWDVLHRQVRIEGRVSRVTTAESDAYFSTRPRGSQVGAWASPQSRVIKNRAALESRLQEVERQYPHAHVPRPPDWGGYRLQPIMVEFWQGRRDRLHDRLCYRLQESGSWLIERLSP